MNSLHPSSDFRVFPSFQQHSRPHVSPPSRVLILQHLTFDPLLSTTSPPNFHTTPTPHPKPSSAQPPPLLLRRKSCQPSRSERLSLQARARPWPWTSSHTSTPLSSSHPTQSSSKTRESLERVAAAARWHCRRVACLLLATVLVPENSYCSTVL